MYDTLSFRTGSGRYAHAYLSFPHTQKKKQPVNPPTPTLLKMMMRAFVVNNYTKKRNHFAAKIYPTLCYGDLDRELDFPSCEISFCSPAGQPHHFAIPHCRLPSLHAHAARAFSSPRVPFAFAASSLTLFVIINVSGRLAEDCELCVSLHWLCISPNVEKWHPKPSMRITSIWPIVTGRGTSYVYENESGAHLVDRQMSNFTLQKPFSISPSGIKVTLIWGSLTPTHRWFSINKKWIRRLWACPSTI